MTAGRSCSDRWPVLVAWLLYAATWSCVGEAEAQEDAVPREDLLPMEIGVIQGDHSRMFGRIDDVDVDSKGNIVVLDGQSYSVSWFSPDGRYLGIAGRQGEGPAEFQGPEGLAVGPDNLVYVLDAPMRTVHVFGLSSSDGPRHVRTISVDVFASDICIAGDEFDSRIVLLGQAPPVTRTTPLVHVLSLDGDELSSFGLPLDGVTDVAPPVLRRTIAHGNNRGDLSYTTDRVTITSGQLGIVRSYSLTGELVWITEIEDFAPVRWVVDNNRVSMGMDPKLGRTNSVSAIATMAPRSVVLTIHEASATNWSGQHLLMAADLETGETSSSRAEGLVATSIVDGRLYGYANTPYPRVIVRGLPGWLLALARSP